MDKNKTELELVYSEVVDHWNKGDYFKAYTESLVAPYKAAFKIIGDFLSTDSSLSDSEGDNIEKIILGGEKSGLKKMNIKISRNELIGADVAIGKLKKKSNMKVVVGKNSESEYEISVEYK